MAHTNAISNLALAMISSAHRCAGEAYGPNTICFIFKGEELPLIKEDTNGIHIQVRWGEWETYTPSYKEVYKKCWECWLVQKLKVVRNRIIAHQWKREDTSDTPKCWTAKMVHELFPVLTSVQGKMLTRHDGLFIFVDDDECILHYRDVHGWHWVDCRHLTEQQVRDYMCETFRQIGTGL